ncbi:unnamed protein product [Urochloa humidicola]
MADVNDGLDKRTWTYIFGASCDTTVFIPSFHNYRVCSFLGLGRPPTPPGTSPSLPPSTARSTASRTRAPTNSCSTSPAPTPSSTLSTVTV